MLREVFNAVFAAVLESLDTVIGALIAFYGVRWASRREEHRAKEERKIASGERKLELELAMRREIFREGADALAALSQSLGRMINVETPIEAQDELLTTYTGTVSRVSLVSSPETLTAVSDAVKAFAESYLAMTLSKFRIAQRRVQIQLDTQILEAGNLTPEQADHIRQSIRQQQEHLRTVIWRHIEEGYGRLLAFAELVVPIQIAARVEMGLPSNEAELRAMSQTQIALMRRLLGEFLDGVRASATSGSPL